MSSNAWQDLPRGTGTPKAAEDARARRQRLRKEERARVAHLENDDR